MSGVRPPSEQDLAALSDAAWRDVVVHARRALGGLADVHATATVKRLRALPANKLVQGRARRDLALLLATGGPLWLDVQQRLAAGALSAELAWLVAGTDRVASVSPAPSPAPAAPDRDELEKARGRVRLAREERDEARRQLAGSQARLQAAEAEAAVLREALAALETRVADLERQTAEANRDKERAVTRERRRHEATIEGLQAELTTLRRAEEERLRRRQDRQRGREVAELARVAEREVARERERARRAGGAQQAAPGRPSELPPGVAEGTTAHAKALLTAGRRVLVDGYNVTKSTRGDLPDEGAQRQWLEQALLDLAARRGVLPEVFWDGDAATGSSQRVGALLRTFASRDLEADDDIHFAVEVAQEDEPLVVVTDDQGLRARVRPYRVDLLGTQAFSWALRG